MHSKIETVIAIVSTFTLVCIMCFLFMEKDTSNMNDTITVTEESMSYTVTFVDYDNSILQEQEVKANENAIAPSDPLREGYVFAGWDKKMTNISSDITVKALYEEDNLPMLMMDSVNAKAGDTEAKVVLDVRNNPGILGMTVCVEYDENTMTLTGVENGDAVSEVLTLTASNVLESGCRFAWDGQEIIGDDVKDGAVLALSFNIKENAKPGTYEITLSYDDIYDNDVMPITMPVRCGYITIT